MKQKQKHPVSLGDLLLTAIADTNRKPVVIMLDEPVHTEANGFRCDDPTCPCWSDFTEVDEVQERKSNPATAGDYQEAMMRAPLNGNRDFHLMR